MTPEYQVSLEQGFIRVVYRGKAEYDVTSNMLREVVHLALGTKTERVLFDLRQSDSSSYYISTIRHAEDAPSLGIDRSFRMALLGSRGDPMLKYFEDVAVNRGFQVTMVFDSDPNKIGQKVNDLEILSMDTMVEKVKQNKIKIAMLTVPASAAQTVADQLVKAGVKAILNYAPIHLNVPADVHVQHIEPATHLQRMTYYL